MRKSMMIKTAILQKNGFVMTEDEFRAKAKEKGVADADIEREIAAYNVEMNDTPNIPAPFEIRLESLNVAPVEKKAEEKKPEEKKDKKKKK